jgi:preprotein translocase subunit SecD
MEKQRITIALILVLVIAAIVLIVKLPLQLGLDLKGGAQLTIQVLPTEKITQIKTEDLKAVQKTLENRINALGVSEPVVQTIDNKNQILVQLPGVTDTKQAEKVLGSTAQLEFKEQKQGTEAQFQAEFQVKQQLKGQLSILQQLGGDPQIQKEREKITTSLKAANESIDKLFQSVDLTGKNLIRANPQPVGGVAGGNAWEVAISFDEDGATKFANLTKNIAGTGRGLGIFLDNEIISAPSVDVKFADTGITGGNAVITGNFDLEGADNLAIQIRGGSLPFPVKVAEIRTVGATLGQDSIKSSIYAGLAGLFLVFVFMGVYYRVPGLIADTSLIIYTILNLACFSLIGVTMTLPGIAGFILSIGMAVDANVLIFERTREELQAGKTLYKSVESGFYRAFSSILDSNVTTLIACAALFWLGSGLVKGFAVTLAIGVAISMFTALTCSRTLMLLLVLGFPNIRKKPELFAPNLPNLGN